MNVGSVCSRRPVAASESAPLSEIAQLMCEHHVGTVILTRTPDNKAMTVGIITDRDVVRAQLQRAADFSRLRAADVMSTQPLLVNENDSTEQALRHMRERGVRRAPVIDAGGVLCGVVSTDDLIIQLAQQVAALGRLLERQAVHPLEILR